jgi:hypothetical protein
MITALPIKGEHITMWGVIVVMMILATTAMSDHATYVSVVRMITCEYGQG